MFRGASHTPACWASPADTNTTRSPSSETAAEDLGDDPDRLAGLARPFEEIMNKVEREGMRGVRPNAGLMRKKVTDA